MLDYDVCMYAYYLISAIVVTPLSSVSIRVLNSLILEQRSSYTIAQWSSPISFFPLGA
jgi:hypothetical protein